MRTIQIDEEFVTEGGWTESRPLYGLMDSTGTVIVEPRYVDVPILANGLLVTLAEKENGGRRYQIFDMADNKIGGEYDGALTNDNSEYIFVRNEMYDAGQDRVIQTFAARVSLHSGVEPIDFGCEVNYAWLTGNDMVNVMLDSKQEGGQYAVFNLKTLSWLGGDKYYRNVYQMYVPSESRESLWSAEKEAAKGMFLYDVLDNDGNVILADLAWVNAVDGGLFAVQKGFYWGLMDAQGQFIYKESIFSELRD